MLSPTNMTGRYGEYGGQYVPETLMSNLIELEQAFTDALADPAFDTSYQRALADYVGRPTPLYFAQRLSDHYGGTIHLKREDLNHTGSHKINNALGQALLAQRMGKTRVIAETGAGQHGVATASACAQLGLECVVYMGALDCRRQCHNVDRMHMLGATVVSVDAGSRNLKVAVNEAMRDWISNPDETYYVVGSAVGPHPYPLIVRTLQSVIGIEAREQYSTQQLLGLPDAVIACVGGGSNAIGIFSGFLDDAEVTLLGVEAGGRDTKTSNQHAATLVDGRPGVLHGALSYLLQDSDGQVCDTHSIAPGLDYPGVGPEHSDLKDQGRVGYVSVTDQAVKKAFADLSRLEGIVPALESSHALAYARDYLKTNPGHRVLVNLSGRGDKDIQTICEGEIA